MPKSVTPVSVNSFAPGTPEGDSSQSAGALRERTRRRKSVQKSPAKGGKKTSSAVAVTGRESSPHRAKEQAQEEVTGSVSKKGITHKRRDIPLHLDDSCMSRVLDKCVQVQASNAPEKQLGKKLSGVHNQYPGAVVTARSDSFEGDASGSGVFPSGTGNNSRCGSRRKDTRRRLGTKAATRYTSRGGKLQADDEELNTAYGPLPSGGASNVTDSANTPANCRSLLKREDNLSMMLRNDADSSQKGAGPEDFAQNLLELPGHLQSPVPSQVVQNLCGDGHAGAGQHAALSSSQMSEALPGVHTESSASSHATWRPPTPSAVAKATNCPDLCHPPSCSLVEDHFSWSGLTSTHGASDNTLANSKNHASACVEFDHPSQAGSFAYQTISGSTASSSGNVAKCVSVSESGVSEASSSAFSSRLLAAAALGCGTSLECILPKISASSSERGGGEHNGRLQSRPLSISLNGLPGSGVSEESAITFCTEDSCVAPGSQTARRAHLKNNKGPINPVAGRSSSLCVCKFLLGEDVAGYLVGRKGGGIDEFQKRNGPGLRITVSKRGEVFPVLGERIAAAVGVQGSIAKALEEIVDVATKRAMHKEEERRLDSGRKISKPKTCFKLVIPESSARLLQSHVVAGGNSNTTFPGGKCKRTEVLITEENDWFHAQAGDAVAKERLVQVIGLPEDVKQTVLELFPVYQQDATLTTSLELYYGKRSPVVPPPPPYRPLPTYPLDAHQPSHHTPFQAKNRQFPQVPLPPRSGSFASSSATGATRSFSSSTLESLSALKNAPGVEAGLEGLLRAALSSSSSKSSELFDLLSRLAASTESVSRQTHGLAQPRRGGTAPELVECENASSHASLAISTSPAPHIPHAGLSGSASMAEAAVLDVQQCPESNQKAKGNAAQMFAQDLSSKSSLRHPSSGSVSSFFDAHSAAVSTSLLSRDSRGGNSLGAVSTTRLDPSAPVFHPAKQRSSVDRLKGEVKQEQHHQSLPWNPFGTFHPPHQVSTVASLKDMSKDHDRKELSCVSADEGGNARHSIQLSQLLQDRRMQSSPGVEGIGMSLSSAANAAGQREVCCPPPGFSCAGVEPQENAHSYGGSRLPNEFFQEVRGAETQGTNRYQTGRSALDVADSVLTVLRKQDGVLQGVGSAACPGSSKPDADGYEKSDGAMGQAFLERGQLALSSVTRAKAGTNTSAFSRMTGVVTDELSGAAERNLDTNTASSTALHSCFQVSDQQMCAPRVNEVPPPCSHTTNRPSFSKGTRETEGSLSSSLLFSRKASPSDPNRDWGATDLFGPSAAGTFACNARSTDAELPPSQSCWRFSDPVGRSVGGAIGGSSSSSSEFDDLKQLAEIPSAQRLFSDALVSSSSLPVSGFSDLVPAVDLARCVKQILPSSGDQNNIVSLNEDRGGTPDFSFSPGDFTEAVGTSGGDGGDQTKGEMVVEESVQKDKEDVGITACIPEGDSGTGKESMLPSWIRSALERWNKKAFVPQDGKTTDSSELCSVRMDVPASLAESGDSLAVLLVLLRAFSTKVSVISRNADGGATSSDGAKTSVLGLEISGVRENVISASSILQSLVGSQL
ncbi:hypothetical protein CSUI_003186 [Cystoisospora suis]|uniref:KH domain protein n=1 Tax=Cystoisospora suis TaxID=483139 RepID=A0A2C6L6E2_9APIC|nr:hypothetical protein CSUI_003186 [Cystoisospora suis]